MSEETKIAWCDSTVNFWSGCTKVSPGCANCYAETLAGRFDTLGKWGKGNPRQLHENAFKLAAKLNRKPWVCDECGHDEPQPARDRACPQCPCGSQAGYHRRRIFSLSLGDWLDPEVPVEWLARMLDTVRQCPDVDWLLCTKRPELFNERMMALLDAWMEKDATIWPETKENDFWWFVEDWKDGYAPSNIVLLTSVENQEQADKRIPELLRIPAWRRGLSCEPLLGPVNIYPWCGNGDALLDWVIIDGESGDKARPCNVDWIRSLKDQGKAAAVPCFVKQLGANVAAQVGENWPFTIEWDDDFEPSCDPAERVIIHLKDKKGGDWNEWPTDLRVREFYKP